VIRYDTAHGFTQVDRYDFDEALTFADSDINENWEKYKNRFLQKFYP
jgi:hypothetical protein